MEITKIQASQGKEVICVNFKHNNKEGYFEYRCFGFEDDIGIDTVNDYEEEDGEDIYALIHDWVGEHIETRRSIKVDGVEVDY